MPYDLVIRRAQLRGRATLADIAIAGPRIAAVAGRIEAPGRQEIDAAGRLVTEPFVDCHFHIDKAFTGTLVGRFAYPLRDPDGIAPGADPVAQHRALKPGYTVDGVAARIERALALALGHGTLAVRMFVDVDPIQRLVALRAALRARDRYGDRMTLQICAFPQEGGMRDAATVALMEEALALGADVVGGIPWIEPDADAAQEHIARCFALAVRADRDVHLLCDDLPDPRSRTLEMAAAAAIRHGYHGRLACSHAGALRSYAEDHARAVIDLVRTAGAHIVVIPTLNLLGTLTRVEALLAAGVTVCCGQDDLDNFFYPLGRADMLEAAAFLVHAARLTTPQGLETAFDCVTRHGARALRLADYGLHAGARADLVVFEARTVHEALQMQAPRAYVIARGRVVATTVCQTTIVG
ncbi:MAG: amidohydrolase family protein [Armatimonadota bacterium]|nr:amidohydrolase family protein [Armatimonadota bacterium]